MTRAGRKEARVKTLKYMGSTEDGELDAEVTQRVQSGWMNGKEFLECFMTERLTGRSKEMCTGQ